MWRGHEGFFLLIQSLRKGERERKRGTREIYNIYVERKLREKCAKFVSLELCQLLAQRRIFGVNLFILSDFAV